MTAAPTTIVWIHDPELDHWAVLRFADATGLVNTLCLRAFCPDSVSIRTSTIDPDDPHRPHNTCPACEVELRAGTPGAAVAIEAVPELVVDAITEPRAITADLVGPRRGRTDSPRAWDGNGAFVHLEDGR